MKMHSAERENKNLTPGMADPSAKYCHAFQMCPSSYRVNVRIFPHTDPLSSFTTIP